MANQLVVIYWRDIPSQVTAQAGRTRHRVELHERFQHAIDRAAMIAGLEGSDDYIAQWRRDSVPCGDDLEAAATAKAIEIDESYPPPRLGAIVNAGGLVDGSARP
jgi:Virulence factor